MSFREMAAKREQEAEKLDETEIWISIVSKFVTMEFDISNRAEMLMQAVGGDKEIIRNALVACVKSELISNDQAEEMLIAIA